jgi:enoyl-[acyl-carrier-protein] reductase (NADH)
VLHSVAFGNLKPFIADKPEDAVDRKAMEMTLDVMANSLVYWVQDLVRAGLLVRGSKVFSMTSSGSHRVIVGYGAVSAAKAALESHTRQLALELAPRGISVNAFQAGVTDTPAFRMIPHHEQIKEHIMRLHPDGRMTQPEDIAQTLVALMDPRVQWITGTVIRVDGGEDNI